MEDQYHNNIKTEKRNAHKDCTHPNQADDSVIPSASLVKLSTYGFKTVCFALISSIIYTGMNYFNFFYVIV